MEQQNCTNEGPRYEGASEVEGLRDVGGAEVLGTIDVGGPQVWWSRKTNLKALAFPGDHQGGELGGVGHGGIQGCHGWGGTNILLDLIHSECSFKVKIKKEDLDALQQEEEDCEQEPTHKVHLYKVMQ